MLLNISNILGKENLTAARSKIEALKWHDGTKTAGKTARNVKQNLQADLSSPDGKHLHDQLLDALSNHAVLQAAARPRRFTRLLISRTKGDGHYGAHIDNAHMASPTGTLRTDLSFTIFLSDPASYEGGELVVQFPGYTQSFKPAAGDLILYPSTQIHEVMPVTKGERLACVGWIESQISRADQREILFDLTNLRASLETKLNGQSAELLTLNKSIANLLRLWATP